MAEYYVLKRETCPKCKGSKYLEHPIWNAYGEWRMSLEQEIPSESQERLWWEEQGFWGHERPPEEYECDDCAGRGYAEQSVSLRDALREIEQDANQVKYSLFIPVKAA